MFFVLSKTLGLLTVPSNLFVLLVLAGAALLCTRFARAGKRLLLTCLAIYLVVTIVPLGSWLHVALEERFPKWNPASGSPDGIIVLGGAINPDLSAARGQVALAGSAERFTEAVWLARRYPKARIVFTGGNPSLLRAGPPESAFVLDLLETLGIPRRRVELEERSRNTFENVEFTKTLVNPKPGERWLLITSAAHMPRAVGVFRKAGFPVEAYPVDWQSRGQFEVLRFPSHLLSGLGSLDAAAKEWVGLLAYWVTGKTSEFFPRPM
jgi:uncharacterized SAM-binding protein YcdF (DUF218 family)